MTGIPALGLGARLLGLKGMLQRVPWQVWAILALAAAVGAGAWWHGRQVTAALTAAETRGEVRERAKWQAQLAEAHRQAVAWRAQAEQRQQTIARIEKERHDDTLRRNAAVADDLRLRGPGRAAAACPGPGGAAGISAAAGGSFQPGAGSSAAAGSLPAGNGQPVSAIVPWGWVVDTAENHDALRSEVMAWRSWWPKMKASWDQLRAQPKKGTPHG